jgi:hypothetical protein
MPRSYEEQMEAAVIAAVDGATPDEIQHETGLAPADIARVISLENERRKRKEQRHGSM